jgi:S1-C subfamily serine protease
MTAPIILRFGLAVAVAAVLGTATPAHAQRNIRVQEALLRAKPAVVFIIAEVGAEVALDCGTGPVKSTPEAFRETGTGWFVDPNGWIVTNGHVIQPAHEPARWLVNQLAQKAVISKCLPAALERARLIPGERPDAEEAVKRRLLDTVLPSVKVTLKPEVSVLLSNGTRLRAEVKKYSPPVSSMSAKDLALLKVPGDSYPVLPLAQSQEVKIGDPIHILGFPGVVANHELLNESASVEASVTNGAVSGYKEDKSNNPIIQTDAPAAWGNSGGPAVDERGAVVGVLTFVSVAPGTEGSLVQGFNFVIPSPAVRDFVRGTPVQLGEHGRFNPPWFGGLRELFTEDYKNAVRLFEEADRVLPGIPDVKRMLAEARDKVKNPPPRPFPWFWVTIAVTLVSAGGYGLQIFLRWQKNRYRVRPAEVVALIEQGKQPTILDVRKTEAYDMLPLKIPNAVRLAPEELESGISGLELDTVKPLVAYCT